MTFEIKDLTGFGAPITKLIEVVGSGIGIWYRPRAIRNDANATAYAIRVVGDAQTDVERKRTETLALSKHVLEATVEKGLAERTNTRLQYQEERRQNNLEAVANAAATHLPTDVSTDPVDDDWKARFFAVAEDVSNADMQDLWGKVLAGEVARPGSFSLRALEVLRNISQPEAVIFQRMCNLISDRNSILKIDLDNMDGMGLTYDEILKLRGAGLLAAGDNLNVAFAMPLGEKSILVSHCNGLLLIETTAQPVEKIMFNAFSLTSVGVELSDLIQPVPNMSYLTKFADAMRPKCTLRLGQAGQPLETFTTLGTVQAL